MMPLDRNQENEICEWFALCDHPAAGVVKHPVLGDVPTCARCAQQHGLALEQR
jgi:hypothetical protein